MGRFPLIVVTAVAIWIGYTVYTEGADRAFGGLFSMFAREPHGDETAEDRRSRMERIADDTAEPNDRKEPEKPWWQ
ncbi:MAG: hypothetical protein JSU66_04045 [Deltaproteobacteria bacterium]|nr:MAG: hypothetical protein JSU66_04045 [Deltaproteobacteria bacterium]